MTATWAWRLLLTVILVFTVNRAAEAQPESAREGALVLAVNGTAKADGNYLKIGKPVPDNAMLSVEAGSEIKLFGVHGPERIKGRFEGTRASLVPTTQISIAQHLRNILTSIVIFAQRDSSAPLIGHDLWVIRIDMSGNKCIRRNQAPRIAVDRSLFGRRATIYDVDGERAVVVELGAELIDWPAQLPINKTPATYRVTVDQTGVASEWIFRELKDDGSEENTLTQMQQLRCADQLVGYALSLPLAIDVSGEQ
jgi:hypothetical protein